MSISLLELLCQQQAGQNDTGLRLTLHPGLVEPLQFMAHPYHYCGATGNTALAVHLYSKGYTGSAQQQIVVASVSSSGVNGSTPWQKTLATTPAEVARLAGHGRTAAVLEVIQLGVPLKWSPAQHSKYPDTIRAAVREVIEALLTCGWYVHLPGPARMAVAHQAAADVCKQCAWGSVQDQEWAAAEKGSFGPVLDAQVAYLVAVTATKQGDSSDGEAADTEAQNGQQGAGDAAAAAAAAAALQPVQYHFRMSYVGHGGARRHGRGGKGGWMGLLVRGISSAALWALAAHCRRDTRVLMLAYLAGAATGLTLPTAASLVAQLCSLLPPPP